MRYAAGHIQPLIREASIEGTIASGNDAHVPSILNRSLLPLSLALLLSTTLLGGCASSSVDNALDVAVISEPDEQLSLDNQLSEPAAATQLASGAVPVPVRSPLTMNTALLPDPDQSPVAQAAADIIDDTVDPAQPAAIQTASLQTSTPAQIQTANPVIPASTPTVASEASGPSQGTQLASLSAEDTDQQTVSPPVQAPVKAEKPKSLFEVWFGKKSAQGAKSATKAPAPVKKTVQPGPNIAVASATSQTGARSDNALPGVQRNSVLFGINGDEAGDEDDSVQVASVGSLGRLISPKGLVLQTESVQVDCFKPELLQILGVVEKRYGKKVMVTSGYRSPKGNRRAGGASNSTHIYCKAADIQVEGVSKWDLAKFLRSVPGRGGVGTYCRTESVHIDVGSQRDWHHPCRRSKRKTA